MVMSTKLVPLAAAKKKFMRILFTKKQPAKTQTKGWGTLYHGQIKLLDASKN
jgi:hypothetical protein